MGGRWLGLGILALAAVSWSCGGMVFEMGDPAGWDDDDSEADDDVGDDDVGDDDVGDDDDPPVSNWSWGEVNTSSEADASLVGEDDGDSAADYPHCVGDLNGDSLEDLAIGSELHSEISTRGGKVYFVFGRQQGWALGEPLAPHPSVIGDLEDRRFCQADALGDVNGDGYADVAIDPCWENAPPGSNQFVVLGRETGWAASVPASSLDGSAEITHADETAEISTDARLGDFDGDGLDDWLMFGETWLHGEAHVVSGADITLGLQLPDADASWIYGDGGHAVDIRAAGDLNGDGLGDLVASSPPSTYSIRIVFGRSAALPLDTDIASAADVTLVNAYGSQLDDWANVGDVNDDGYDDLAVSTELAGPEHVEGLFLFLGGSTWPSMLTTDDADVHIAQGYQTYLGDPIGDVNGDGYLDLVFTDTGPTGQDGATAHLLFGRPQWPGKIELTDVDVTIEREGSLTTLRAYEWFGQTRGDLDGNGMDDLLLYYEQAEHDGLEDAGRIMVFAGRAQWPSHLTTGQADVAFAGDVAGQRMGTHDSTLVMDLNADGYDDLISTSDHHPTATEAGETFIFFGQPQ